MNKVELLNNPIYQEILATIDKEVDYVSYNSYSRDIISLNLQQADANFGTEVANDLIEEFELESLGWSKVHPEDNI